MMSQKRFASIAARWLTTIIEVALGAWLGFWRGMLVAIVISLLLAAGYWGGKRVDVAGEEDR